MELVTGRKCLVGVFAIIFAYHVVAKEYGTRQKDSIALITIMDNQMVTTLQILGVFGRLLISWPEPFATVLAISSLVNLELDSLNFGCVVPGDPVLAY